MCWGWNPGPQAVEGGAEPTLSPELTPLKRTCQWLLASSGCSATTTPVRTSPPGAPTEPCACCPHADAPNGLTQAPPLRSGFPYGASHLQAPRRCRLVHGRFLFMLREVTPSASISTSAQASAGTLAGVTALFPSLEFVPGRDSRELGDGSLWTLLCLMSRMCPVVPVVVSTVCPYRWAILPSEFSPPFHLGGGNGGSSDPPTLSAPFLGPL